MTRLSKDAYYLIIIAVLVALCGQLYFTAQYLPLRSVQVFYNQDTKLNQKIIQEIQSAQEFVYFAIYTFTRNDIKDALLGAKHRGLDVRGLTDKSQIEKIELQKKIVEELREAEIPVAIQDHLGIMHLKTLVTDKAYISGSYNWTAAATNLNDEVLEIGYDEPTRREYKRVLEKLFKQYANKSL